MKILLVGGSSGGSVAPLLAVAEEIQRQINKPSFLFVGTKTGPERILAEKTGIEFVSVSAGKWRRYLSFKNILTPFLVFAGFIESLKILRKYKPNVIFGTGSFVQVPLIWAGWCLKIPAIIHQQDYVPSLANTLCQFAAKNITVTFQKSLRDFSSSFAMFYKTDSIEKVKYTGNPFRKRLLESDKQKAETHFGLKKEFPTLLVLGGGTGAEFFNELIIESLQKLSKTVQIIHITGRGKERPIKHENYTQLAFTTHMAEAYAAADFVLCRAGLSTLTELSALQKIAIVVPMPKSHQQANALYVFKKQAAIVLPQEHLDSEMLVDLIRKLLFEHKVQARIKHNIAKLMPKDAGKQIAKLIITNGNKRK